MNLHYSKMNPNVSEMATLEGAHSVFKDIILVRTMSRITGLYFRGAYCSPPASSAKACVALAADHLAFAALALLEGSHWQHDAKQHASAMPTKHELRNLRTAKASMQWKEMCTKITDHML